MALTLKNKDSGDAETQPYPPSISDLPEPVFPEDRAKLLAPTCFQCGKKISGSHFAMGFLGILIVLFGLFEAWRLNKGVKLEFEPVDSV